MREKKTAAVIITYFPTFPTFSSLLEVIAEQVDLFAVVDNGSFLMFWN